MWNSDAQPRPWPGGAGQLNGLKRMLEFCLGLLLPGEEAHVINRQQGQAPVSRTESVHGALANGRDVLIGELLPSHVSNAGPATVQFDDPAAEALEEVGLPESTSAMHVEGGEGGMIPFLGQAGDSGPGKPIAVPDDEAVELV